MPELRGYQLMLHKKGEGRLTFSWVLSACQAFIMETITENTHGGADMSKVGTYANPRVPVRVG
jgi:hypothetical protein